MKIICVCSKAAKNNIHNERMSHEGIGILNQDKQMLNQPFSVAVFAVFEWSSANMVKQKAEESRRDTNIELKLNKFNEIKSRICSLSANAALQLLQLLLTSKIQISFEGP